VISRWEAPDLSCPSSETVCRPSELQVTHFSYDPGHLVNPCVLY
jgi:hypothetical protein